MNTPDLRMIRERVAFLRQKTRNHFANARHERQTARTCRTAADELEAIAAETEMGGGSWVDVGKLRRPLKTGGRYFVRRSFGSWAQEVPCFAEWTGSWRELVGTIESQSAARLPKGELDEARVSILVWVPA